MYSRELRHSLIQCCGNASSLHLLDRFLDANAGLKMKLSRSANKHCGASLLSSHHRCRLHRRDCMFTDQAEMVLDGRTLHDAERRWSRGFFDHHTRLVVDGEPVILSHPYRPPEEEHPREPERRSNRHGEVIARIESPAQSWYNPGRTSLVIIGRPELVERIAAPSIHDTLTE